MSLAVRLVNAGQPVRRDIEPEERMNDEPTAYDRHRMAPDEPPRRGDQRRILNVCGWAKPLHTADEVVIFHQGDRADATRRTIGVMADKNSRIAIVQPAAADQWSCEPAAETISSG